MANLLTGLGGIAGFGENFLARNDDNFTGYIDVSSVFANGLNFFGTTYHGVYINNNGNVTFAAGRSTYTPSSIVSTTSNPEIDPFYADVDTRGGAVAATPGGASTGADIVWYDLDAANRTVTVTWDDVGYFGSHTNKLNAFQLVLSDASGVAGRQAGDFDITFRYEDINWTTGDASGGSNGLGGTVARAGFSAGQGTPTSYYELPQSGNQDAMLALDTTAGNTGFPGLWRFEVTNGDIPAVVSVQPENPTVTEGDAGSFATGFLVTRSGDISQSLTVPYTITGFGNAPADNLDFDGLTLPRQGQVSFNPGQSQAEIVVYVQGDTIVEANQSFAVTLGEPSDPAVRIGNGQAVTTILDNDGNGPPIPAEFFRGLGSGDPHLTTLDGLHYDFQAVGEFHLARTGDGAFDVQVRTAPRGTSEAVSVVTAVATDVGGTAVTYDVRDHALRIGGTTATIDPSVGHVDVGSSGGRVYRNADGSFEVTFPGGQEIVTFSDFGDFLRVNVAVAPALGGTLQGLLGNADGTAGNDLQLPDGTVLPASVSYSQIYGAYADGWRISQAESLFDYRPGESTTSFTDTDFPRLIVTIDNLPADLVAAARAAAQAAGVTNPTLIDDAALDFVLTGDSDFLVAQANTVTVPASNASFTNRYEGTGLGISADLPAQDERDAGSTPFTFTVYRTNGSGELDVTYAVVGAGADADHSADAADFGGILPSGIVHFADGQTRATLTVDVSGDASAEFDETFAVVLSGPAAGIVMLSDRAPTIVTNDDGPVPARLSIAADAAIVPEGNAGSTPYAFTVTRSGDLTGSVSVDVTVGPDATGANPTADATDFTNGFSTQRITFGPGETSRSVSVNVAGDTLVEGNEGFTVGLANVAGGAVVSGTASGVIGNDDVQPAGPGAPVAVADGGAGFATGYRTAFTTASVLANDTDPNGDTLRVTGVDTTGLRGTLVNNGDGTFGYDPGSAFDGLAPQASATTSFGYTISDGTSSATATATITVARGLDISPVATDDTAATAYQTPVLIDIGANDYDPDGRIVVNRYNGINFPQHGFVTFNADGTALYTPQAGFSGTDSFVYEAIDNDRGRDTATVTVTVGNPPAGGQTLSLRVSEDAYGGDARFIVLANGQQVGGVHEVTASHAAGQYQDIAITDAFAANPLSIAVKFVNDLYGGSPALDRNLYVDSLTLNGVTYQGEQAFNTAGPNTATEAVLLGSGPNDDYLLTFDTRPTLTVRVAEDAYGGDAQFVVLVDGQQVGGVQTATASHAAGQYQDITLRGAFPADPAHVTVKFVNDLYGGSPALDRNLYVDSLTLNGVTYQGEQAANTAGPNTATEAVLYGAGPNGDFALDFMLHA